jgi:hypothetical protein
MAFWLYCYRFFLLLHLQLQVFAFQTQKLVKELTLLRTEPTSVATVEPTTEPVATSSSMTVDLTAGWKIYTNQKYNFSLSYPGLWNKDDAGSLIAVSDTQGNYSLQIDAVEVYESGYCYTWDKETAISIAGKSARMRNGTYTGKPAEICGTTSIKDTNRMVTQIFIPYQGSVELLISYYYSVTDLDSAKVMLNQILSTFKYTN